MVQHKRLMSTKPFAAQRALSMSRAWSEENHENPRVNSAEQWAPYSLHPLHYRTFTITCNFLLNSTEKCSETVPVLTQPLKGMYCTETVVAH
jgi:hypothetical protein